MFQNLKMEIKPEMLNLTDWEALEETANQIIKNATRDLILWTNVLKEVEKQKKKCKIEPQEAESEAK